MESRLRRDTLTVEQEKGFVPRRKPVEMSFNFARPLRLVEIPGGTLPCREAFEEYGIPYKFCFTLDNNPAHLPYYSKLFGEARAKEWSGPNADINLLEFDNVPDCDIFVGTPPCQHSTPGGRPDGVKHWTFVTVETTCRLVVHLAKRNCLKMYWIEQGGKSHFQFNKQQSARDVCVAILEQISTFSHKTFQWNNLYCDLPHDRLRWIYAGVRLDILARDPFQRDLADPLDFGYEDIYHMLNMTLPNLRYSDPDPKQNDLTVKELKNFRDFEKTVHEIVKGAKTVNDSQRIGLIATCDPTRKFTGVYDPAFRVSGVIGSLTSKDVKKIVMSTWDTDKPIEEKAVCRILHPGERWQLQGRDPNLRRNWGTYQNDLATGESLSTNLVICTLFPFMKQMENADIIRADMSKEAFEFDVFCSTWTSPTTSPTTSLTNEETKTSPTTPLHGTGRGLKRQRSDSSEATLEWAATS